MHAIKYDDVKRLILVKYHNLVSGNKIYFRRGWWKGENNVDIKGHIILVTNSYWLQGWGLKGLEGVGHNE